MDWWIYAVGAVVVFLILRQGWSAYTHPAHVLGRQAANMNWVAVGRVEDEAGYKNVKLSRGDFEAVISYVNGNVTLTHPYVATPFQDFLEIERWLATENLAGVSAEAENAFKDIRPELGSILDSLSRKFTDFIDEKVGPGIIETAVVIGRPETADTMKLIYDSLSIRVAFMALLLALETKHHSFRQNDDMQYLRTISCGRVTLAEQKFLSFAKQTYGEGNEPLKEIRSKALSNAAKYIARCEAVVEQVKESFIADVEHPLDAIYKLIEEVLPLAHKGDAHDRDEMYRGIFVEMAEEAKNRI